MPDEVRYGRDARWAMTSYLEPVDAVKSTAQLEAELPQTRHRVYADVQRGLGILRGLTDTEVEYWFRHPDTRAVRRKLLSLIRSMFEFGKDSIPVIPSDVLVMVGNWIFSDLRFMVNLESRTKPGWSMIPAWGSAEYVSRWTGRPESWSMVVPVHRPSLFTEDGRRVSVIGRLKNTCMVCRGYECLPMESPRALHEYDCFNEPCVLVEDNRDPESFMLQYSQDISRPSLVAREYTAWGVLSGKRTIFERELWNGEQLPSVVKTPMSPSGLALYFWSGFMTRLVPGQPVAHLLSGEPQEWGATPTFPTDEEFAMFVQAQIVATTTDLTLREEGKMHEEALALEALRKKRARH